MLASSLEVLKRSLLCSFAALLLQGRGFGFCVQVFGEHVREYEKASLANTSEATAA